MKPSSFAACRIFKLAQGSGNQGGYCEPIAFTVPRKSELYQHDLYPDTFSGEASLEAEEWYTEGKSAAPKLVTHAITTYSVIDLMIDQCIILVSAG